MSELTENQEKTLREFLHEDVVPLIEDVLVKKLGQAMSYAKEQIATPKREWVGLTEDNNGFELGLASCADSRYDPQSFIDGARWAETKLREKNG